MAAFYYVKSGGVATGDNGRVSGTRSTGTFAAKGTSNYYNDISDAFTVPSTGPAVGDFIMVSHLHSGALPNGLAIPGSNLSHEFPLYMMSVDDANLDQYKKGAAEVAAIGGGYRFRGVMVTFGIDLDGNPVGPNQVNNHWLQYDSIMRAVSANPVIKLTADGTSITLIDVDIDTLTTSKSFQIKSGAKFHMFRGAVTGTGSLVDPFWVSPFDAGGAHLEFWGVDLSHVGTVMDVGQDEADNNIYCRLDRCEMSSTHTFNGEVFDQVFQYLLATHCTDVSAASEHQYYQQTTQGEVEDATDIWRDETLDFTSGIEVSMKMLPKSNVSPFFPLVFDMEPRPVLLSDTDEDVVTVYFAVADTTTLDDVNFWVELIYPDGTNQHIYNTLSTRNADVLLASGTTHTDDSGSSTWKDSGGNLTGFNEYRLELDTSVDVGADCVPIVRIHLGIDADVYVDTTVGVS